MIDIMVYVLYKAFHVLLSVKRRSITFESGRMGCKRIGFSPVMLRVKDGLESAAGGQAGSR